MISLKLTSINFFVSFKPTAFSYAYTIKTTVRSISQNNHSLSLHSIWVRTSFYSIILMLPTHQIMCTTIWTGLSSERSPGSFMWLGNISCPFLCGGLPLQWMVSLLFEESVLSVEISPTVWWSILCIRFTYSVESSLICWGPPRSVKGPRALWRVPVFCEGSPVLWRVFLLCGGFLQGWGPYLSFSALW